MSEYVATLLKPHLEQKVEGEAFVKQLFSVKKKRKTIPIIGCEVQMGKVSVGSMVKVLRFVFFCFFRFTHLFETFLLT